MAKLYSQLALIYHEMYQSIFDYEEEFAFYDKVLRKHNCKKILEIGCGSGNLTKYFTAANYDYQGLDKSKQMLEIARDLNPATEFIQADMRKLNLKEKFDAVLITGRSFTHMTKNSDVMAALNSISKILRVHGILIFDNFNANVIFGDFQKISNLPVNFQGKKYERISNNSPNLKTGWTWNWNAKYTLKENGKTRILYDKSVLRAFTKDELKLFLKVNKFKILETKSLGLSLVIISRKI